VTELLILTVVVVVLAALAVWAIQTLAPSPPPPIITNAIWVLVVLYLVIRWIRVFGVALP
jgi:hypothetical protein